MEGGETSMFKLREHMPNRRVKHTSRGFLTVSLYFTIEYEYTWKYLTFLFTNRIVV